MTLLTGSQLHAPVACRGDPWELESTTQVHCMLFVVLLCQYRNILSYMQKGHVLQVIFVECQVFYVWNMKKRGRESVKEKSSLASQSFFSVCVHVRAKVGGGREGKYVWADLPGFCDSVVCAECLPRVHNDYY